MGRPPTVEGRIRSWIESVRPHAWAISSGHPSLDAIEAVLDLHKPTAEGTCGYCAETLTRDGGSYYQHPCPTVRAIEEKLP